MSNCPICNEELIEFTSGFINDIRCYIYNCPRCGYFRVPHFLELSKVSITTRTLISSYLYFFNKDENNSVNTETITKDFIKRFENKKFPTPVEQMERFILFLGDFTKIPGKAFYFDSQNKNEKYYKLLSTIPFVNASNYFFIVKSCYEEGFVNDPNTSKDLYLSLKGWEKYEELKRGKNNSQKAFMAMQYCNKELEQVFENIIKPGLKELGFEINRLDKTNKNGLIDENLRVEIRDSKFLVVDLSDGNRGAYWEAGYGEGLGKKIFYICDKQKCDKFKNRKKKLVHFDVEHQNLYFWNDPNPENSNKFINSLKAGIRLAFPNNK